MSTGEPSRVRAAAGRSEEVARDLESELMGPRDPMNPDDPRNFDKDGNRIPDRLGQVWFEHLFREMRKGGLLSPTGSRPLPVPPPRRVPPTPEEEAAILESSRKQALCSRLNYLSRLAAHEKRKQRWAQALEERKRELARKARHERLLFEECRRSRWIWGFVAIAGMLILSAAQQRSRFFELVGIVGFFLEAIPEPVEAITGCS